MYQEDDESREGQSVCLDYSRVTKKSQMEEYKDCLEGQIVLCNDRTQKISNMFLEGVKVKK